VGVRVGCASGARGSTCLGVRVGVRSSACDCVGVRETLGLCIASIDQRSERSTSYSGCAEAMKSANFEELLSS
jgi:hypothetical protein